MWCKLKWIFFAVVVNFANLKFYLKVRFVNWPLKVQTYFRLLLAVLLRNNWSAQLIFYNLYKLGNELTNWICQFNLAGTMLWVLFSKLNKQFPFSFSQKNLSIWSALTIWLHSFSAEFQRESRTGAAWPSKKFQCPFLSLLKTNWEWNKCDLRNNTSRQHQPSLASNLGCLLGMWCTDSSLNFSSTHQFHTTFGAFHNFWPPKCKKRQVSWRGCGVPPESTLLLYLKLELHLQHLSSYI